MAEIWRKIDSDTTLANQPYSAFLACGLTRNINGYPKDLASQATAVWQSATPTVWASYDAYTGTVVSYDVGMNASQVTITLQYSTVTAAVAGLVQIKHIEAGGLVTVEITPTTTVDSLSVDFTFQQPVSGIQSFFVGFKSNKAAESRGSVNLRGGVANQIFADNIGSTYPFNLLVGGHEIYDLLVIDEASANGVPNPIADSRREYQIGYFRHFPNNNLGYHGTFTIWPELEQGAAFLPTAPSGSLQMGADLYELGALKLLAISCQTSVANTSLAPMPLAHDLTTPLASLISIQQRSANALRPSLVNNSQSAGFLNNRLPAGSAISFCFSPQYETVARVQVGFRAFAYNQAQPFSSEIRLRIFDFENTLLAEAALIPNQMFKRIQPQPSYIGASTASIVANGIAAGVPNWSMRDAMPYADISKGQPIQITYSQLTFKPFFENESKGDGVYTVKIDAQIDLYVYNLFARFI